MNSVTGDYFENNNPAETRKYGVHTILRFIVFSPFLVLSAVVFLILLVPGIVYKVFLKQ